MMFSTILGLIGIPSPQKLAIMALVAVGVFGAGFVSAWKIQGWRMEASVAQAQTQVIAETKKEDAVTFTAGTASEEAQQKIVTQTITVIKRIPQYVTAKADNACVVPRGFVRLHNAAATIAMPSIPNASGKLDGAAGQDVDSPSGVALSTVAGTIATNYGAYAQVSQQLADLQAWVTQQQTITTNGR